MPIHFRRYIALGLISLLGFAAPRSQAGAADQMLLFKKPCKSLARVIAHEMSHVVADQLGIQYASKLSERRGG